MRLQQHQDIDDWVVEAQAIYNTAGGILVAPRQCSKDLASLLIIQMHELYHLYDCGRAAIERLRSFRAKGGNYPVPPVQTAHP